MEKEDLLFDVVTPLGCRIYTTKRYWDYIISIKHPYINGMESDVIITLKNPDFIRQSRIDKTVILFYREIKCVW